MAKLVSIQFTGGSSSMIDHFDKLRHAGAAAREALKAAAAARWNVATYSLEANAGVVTDPASGRSATYGELALEAAPLTWTIGRGRSLAGNYDIRKSRLTPLGKDAESYAVNGPDDPRVAELLQEHEREAAIEELNLAIEGLKPFDRKAYLEGHLTPVLWGSALKDFGVRDLIDALAEFAPSPRAQDAATRKVEATEPKMTGFVFKIQANMDPNHRDRIAFMRVCSGVLRRGMRAKLVRTGKPVTLSAPQFFFAQDRSLAEEAYAGDVVGIPNHG
uniref:EF-Tu/IF-2/RF-3 family GTPase n=1 Tax=uncultured Rhizobium sp. TaxID=155567 RepID=UPI00345B433C